MKHSHRSTGVITAILSASVIAVPLTGQAAQAAAVDPSSTGSVSSSPIVTEVADGKSTGGDVTSSAPDISAGQRKQDAAKSDLVGAWTAAGKSPAAARTYRASVANYVGYFGRSSMVADPAAAASDTATPDSAIAAAATPPKTYVLGLTSYGQSKGYYCGPASAYNILKYKKLTTSKYTKATTADRKLSQAVLATSYYLKTNANGGTSWASDNFRTGLNRWRSNSSTGFYVSHDTPSAALFGRILVYDVYNNKMPFGADTVEVKNGVHYNNHPNRTIGHWLTAYGYTGNGSPANSGDTVYFADPSWSLWSSSYGVKTKFTYSSASFTNRFLQNNGVTW